MIQNNRLWVLISRLLSGEASPAEAQELQQLLEQSPEKQYLPDILHSYFTVLPANIAGPNLADTDLETRFRKIVDPEKADPKNADPADPGKMDNSERQDGLWLGFTGDDRTLRC